MLNHGNAPRNGGASRNSLAACFRGNLTPLTLQTQFLTDFHGVPPELAPVVATLAFSGGGGHG